jgi:hypothetical protein
VSRRDAARFRAELERGGLTVRIARNGHWRVELPDGRFVGTVPNSPSDFRAVANCRSHIRRRLAELRWCHSEGERRLR